jgi:Sulfotransferase family
MISFQKRFLFVHIPKTGGNSIQSVLAVYSEDEITRRPVQDGVERFDVSNPKYKLKKHSPLADYRAALGEEQFSQLYKFASVRNPWDRMVSFYFTPTQRRKWNRKAFKKTISEALPAADYLRLDKKEPDPFSNVSRIIRFEHLAEDFRAVCAELGIPAQPLPHYNRSEREHYSKYYDHELRALVAQRFAVEIARFGYTFDWSGGGGGPRGAWQLVRSPDLHR